MGTAGLQPTGQGLGVGGLEGLGHLIQADLIAGEALRVDRDADLLAPAADDQAGPGVLDLPDGLEHVLGEQAQLPVVHVRNPVAIQVL